MVRKLPDWVNLNSTVGTIICDIQDNCSVVPMTFSVHLFFCLVKHQNNRSIGAIEAQWLLMVFQEPQT